MAEKTFTESFRVAGEQLVDAVKRLFHEGNVRRVIIKHEGNTVVEFPLTVGVQRIALEAAESLGVNPDTFGRDRPDRHGWDRIAL